MDQTRTGLEAVTITGRELDATLRCYEAALTALGLERLAELVDEEEDDGPVEAVGWGPPGGAAQVWVVTGEAAGAGVHIRLRAPSREAVDRFHAAALAAGATEHTPPRRWTLYRRGEYHAVVRDPDGNQLEAVADE